MVKKGSKKSTGSKSKAETNRMSGSRSRRKRSTSAALSGRITQLCSEAIDAKKKALEDPIVQQSILASAQLLAKTILSGGTVYACGNGGSACDAMHLCEELVAQYKRVRPGVKAMHFMDNSTLTCWGNDHGFVQAYERYAETFCGKKDLLIAISTSGSSENVILAAKAAIKKGSKVLVLTGKGGGKLAGLGDVVINIPLYETERIQEIHITCIHIWCELLETGLVPALNVS
jgi:D-sedoheptulose 7-phosphate isomerase